ncbi:SdrD B-like domain-containing protein [Nocardioides sp. LHD-245]|uniref:SdrD B-like domain-containing protein n=1 Tax=Nocardioides sp. LHD-245 TaxID=3051387 RepID=UPI0027E07272|nr:SdrD B-like domain-containing protein [Nocardioides sp. LHD-245]
MKKRWFEQLAPPVPRYAARRLTALVVAVSGMAVLGGTQIATPAYAAPGDGTVKVRVVQDYNGNGSWDDPFVEPGLAGVTVRVTDAAGVTQDLTTDADGLVTVVGTPGSYRVQAINPDPATLQPAFAREKTGTADTPSAKWLSSNDEFVTVAADKTVDVTTAFWDVRDYCQSNPLIVNACQQPIFTPGGALANNGTAETLFTAPYRAWGNDRGKTSIATKADTGAVYGIGYRKQDKRIFSAAFAKRGIAYGPGGAGAIYVTPRDGGATTVWGTVPNPGTRAHSFETAGLRQDWDFAPAVGKESLGDLDISEDGDDLQVINLNDRKLYVYDATAATMGAPTHVVDLSANPGCAAASDWRPGALGERNGVLYVGGVCSAESTQNPADQRAIILSFDASTYTQTGTVMDQTINRKREAQWFLAAQCDPRDTADGVHSTTFRPWMDGISCNFKSGGRLPDPQAWMDDIVIENNGDLVMAFRDRTGDQQMGASSRYYANTDGTGALVGVIDYVVAGDINKACPPAGGGDFVLDINGGCGKENRAQTAVSDEYFGGDGGVHEEEAFGGLALSRGERGIVSSAMDPAGGIFTQGYFRLDRETGQPLISGDGGTQPTSPESLQANGGNGGGNRITGADNFSKGQGMADMEVLCDLAPIQIGNRVWNDTNDDGIQDAGEDGIAGVTVNLYAADGVTLVATTVTNSRGEYYFDSIDDDVEFNTDYVIRLDKPEDYTGSGKLAGVGLSDEDQGTGPEQDRLDSDGTIVANYPQASITTGNRGENDHTIDFGFSPASVSVGNYVWVDSDGDGIQDPGEPGIEGVVLELTDSNGDPVVDVNGDPVGPVTTDANGHYVFDKLPVLPPGEHYTVTIDQTAPSTQTALAPYNPTLAGQGGDPALDSSLWTADSTELTTAGAKDLTLDFGFTPKPVSVGDYVWVDSDGDGIQDPGEPGIPGVTLTLLGPDGNVIGTTTTDANGHYVFTDLPVLPDPDDRYTVTIDNGQPALAPYVPTQAGQGGDPAQDSSTGSATSGPLTQAQDRDMTLDFGFVPAKVSVGDLVWADTDRDGVQDAGEPGIEGVVLTIVGPDGEPVTDVNGDPVGPVTTDADGNYSFDDLPVLPAGQHYTVKIDRTDPSTIAALSDYIPTQTGQGTPGTDSSTWEAESGDLTGDGDRDPTLDFGFVRPAVSVGDFVWADADRDGIQDAGESGIPGVVLVLTGPRGETVTDIHGNPVGPVTTDANGKYLFDDLPVLPAGQHYTVSIDRDAPSTQTALAPYGPTQAGAGGDRGADSSTWSATSGDLTDDGDQDLTLDFGFVLLPNDVTLTTQTSHATAKVGVALSDVVTISGFRPGGTSTGSATLYGPFSSPGAATCTPATAVGTVAFTPANGTVRTPSITVNAPGHYTWVASTTADDLNKAATHACGLKEETSLVRRAVNPVRVIDTGFEGSADRSGAARKTRPAKLGFAKLGIQAKVKPIGLTGKKANVPGNRNLTGWLRTSAELGDVIGTAVIVGHVSDNHDRPGAFFDLKKAKKGQTVELTDKAGVVRTYQVVKTKRYLRSKLLPKKLFSMTSQSRVQLVTCTDKVTYGNGRFHYRKNLVVTLVPVS